MLGLILSNNSSLDDLKKVACLLIQSIKNKFKKIFKMSLVKLLSKSEWKDKEEILTSMS